MEKLQIVADFGMIARDDGFKLSGINPDDTVLFRATNDIPKDGSIVAVSIDGNPAMLKRIRFYDEGLSCYLETDSGKYPAILIDDLSRLKVIGVAVGTFHCFHPELRKGC